MNVIQDITIDVSKPRQTVIHVVQEDSTRKIRLTLLKDNLPFNVQQDLTEETVYGFVEFRKADGHGGMYDTTSLGDPAVELEDAETASNVWIVSLDGNCFTCPGWTQINVRFETEDGKRIHTFRIMVDVEPTASSDTESTDWGELNSIADLRNAVSAMWDKMFTPEAKQALIACFEHVGWKGTDGREYLDALEEAMFQTAQLVSISAVFDQGSAVIYNTDDLDTLRQYLTVTATYEDLSTREITGYTLSGTLTVGTSTITVSYGGKTATFDVTVSDFMLNDILTLDGIQNTRSGHNANAEAWEDLSGNQNDFAGSGQVWDNNSAVFNATARYFSKTVDLQGDRNTITIEFVAKIVGNGSYHSSFYGGFVFGNCPIASTQGRIKIYSYNTGGFSSYYGNTSTGYSAASNVVHIAFVFTSSGVTRYINGVAQTPISLTYQSGTKENGWRIGSSTDNDGYFNGNIYRIGVSSYAMTAAEVAERYQFFKSRFNIPDAE